jgi:hypothetical protein
LKEKRKSKRKKVYRSKFYYISFNQKNKGDGRKSKKKNLYILDEQSFKKILELEDKGYE